MVTIHSLNDCHLDNGHSRAIASVSTQRSIAFIAGLGFGAVLAASSPAMAQTTFDSGSVLRQIERTLPVPSLPSVGPEEELPKVSLLQGKGERLFVRKLIVTGNTLVETSVLQEALTPYEGRSLTLSDLQSAAAAVALAYRKVGLMASCGSPIRRWLAVLFGCRSPKRGLAARWSTANPRAV